MFFDKFPTNKSPENETDPQMAAGANLLINR